MKLIWEIKQQPHFIITLCKLGSVHTITSGLVSSHYGGGSCNNSGNGDFAHQHVDYNSYYDPA